MTDTTPKPVTIAELLTPVSREALIASGMHPTKAKLVAEFDARAVGVAREALSLLNEIQADQRRAYGCPEARAPRVGSLVDEIIAEAAAAERDAIVEMVKRWCIDAPPSCGLRDMPGGAPPSQVFAAMTSLVERIRARGAR